MGNSLETRLPFLDYRFVELALGLPNRVKVRAGYGKWILRSTMRGRVPASIRTARYKRGFDAPQAMWIDGGLGAAMRQRLQSQRQALQAWLPLDTHVDEVFADQRLAADGTAFAEATSVLWLAMRT
jgi:asparagine synthase (glutamine-hydrolysing)